MYIRCLIIATCTFFRIDNDRYHTFAVNYLRMRDDVVEEIDINASELFRSPQIWWLLAPPRKLFPPTTSVCLYKQLKEHQGAGALSEFQLEVYTLYSSILI